MEVTEEMIKAVQEYQAAEYRRKADEEQRERLRKYQERIARIENQAKEGVRAVIPGLTDDQFATLADVFDTYFEEMWDR